MASMPIPTINPYQNLHNKQLNNNNNPGKKWARLGTEVKNCTCSCGRYSFNFIILDPSLSSRHEIPCSITFLELRLPHFFKDFEGNSFVIDIPVRHHVFNHFLQYIYTSELPQCPEDNYDDIIALLKLGKQFCPEDELPFFNNLLIPRIVLNPENVSVFQKATVLTEMVTSYLQRIHENIEDFVETQEFLDLNTQSMISLLKSDDLNITEIKLFQSVVRWGKKQIAEIIDRDNRSVAAELEFLRRKLTPILPFIRFPLMSKNEFLENVVGLELLSKRDVKLLGIYIDWDEKEVGNIPDLGLEWNTKPRHSHVRSQSLSGCIISLEDGFGNITKVWSVNEEESSNPATVVSSESETNTNPISTTNNCNIQNVGKNSEAINKPKPVESSSHALQEELMSSQTSEIINRDENEHDHDIENYSVENILPGPSCVKVEEYQKNWTVVKIESLVVDKPKHIEHPYHLVISSLSSTSMDEQTPTTSKNIRALASSVGSIIFLNEKAKVRKPSNRKIKRPRHLADFVEGNEGSGKDDVRKKIRNIVIKKKKKNTSTRQLSLRRKNNYSWCLLCNIFCDSIEGCLSHYRKFHPYRKEMEWKCLFCSKLHKKRMSLFHHRKVYHSNYASFGPFVKLVRTDGSGDKPKKSAVKKKKTRIVKCPKCEQEFLSSADFATHYKANH